MEAAPTVPAAAPSASVAESLGDLREDFDELLYLARSALGRLDALSAELAVSGERLEEENAALLRSQVQLLRARYRELGTRLLGLRRRAEHAPPAELGELDAERARCAEFLRTEQGVAAALQTAADWQSPPFLSSTDRGAGAEFGRITPHWNDYKRDRHLDAGDYERAFVAELVDPPGEWQALLTSCGMAAFTTILGFLLLERRLDRVVAGNALYHETKLLLERTVPSTVFVDEGDPAALRRAIRGLRPTAVFLDSVCNTRFAPVPDLGAVARELRSVGHETYLVVDNTALASTCQPLALAGGPVRTLVFESLLKYHQLGLDRVNAGVIVARADDAERLAVYREHLGTNLADVAALTLPSPRRHVLERRLRRIERNAALIAERLGTERLPMVEAISYPGRGGWVSVGLRRPALERRLVEESVAEARRRHVALVGGSSFGFDTTRVYLTAARAERGQPFVRIAAGTEHRLGAEAVAETLAAALRRVGRN